MSQDPPPPTAEPTVPGAAADEPPPSIWRVSLSTALVLLLFTLVFTALMAQTYQHTRPAIEASIQEAKLRLIDEVLPREEYDNPLLAERLDIPVPERGASGVHAVYRARLQGAPAALVLEASTLEGYSGRIDLLVAVRLRDAQAQVAAVRVTAHRETPGLGDYIDINKDKNKTQPWIEQFARRSLEDPPPARWAVKKDGGVFDAHAGATISARAVTQAVGAALRFAAANRQRLFAAPVSAPVEAGS